jgi:hypothetical protein
LQCRSAGHRKRPGVAEVEGAGPIGIHPENDPAVSYGGGCQRSSAQGVAALTAAVADDKLGATAERNASASLVDRA